MCSGIAGPAGLAGMGRWCLTPVWVARHFGQTTVRPWAPSTTGRGRGGVGTVTGGCR